MTGLSIVRASIGPFGPEATGDSENPVFSRDGNKVAFWSKALDLVPTDTNVGYDLFVKDLVTGRLTVVTSNSDGVYGNGINYGRALVSPADGLFSPDGTKAIFVSNATNLSSEHSGDNKSTFVKDLVTGATTFVGDGSDSVFSPDSKSIAFGAEGGIFIRNLATGQLESFAATANGYSPVFNPDGKSLLYVEEGSIYSLDLATGSVELFVGHAIAPKFSPDGKTLIYQPSDAAADPVAPFVFKGVTVAEAPADAVFSPDGGRVAFGLNGDVYVEDLKTGVVTQMSTNVSGVPANDFSRSPQFTPDGTKVIFYSRATNLGPSTSNAEFSLFYKDINTGEVSALTNVDGAPLSATTGYRLASGAPIFSADGSKLAFLSTANNLVAGDTNNYADIFVVSLAPSSNHGPGAGYWGTSGADTLTGAGGAPDSLFGKDGDDHLIGLGGKDTLDGGKGDDVLAGGLGDDAYYVTGRGDQVIEGADGGTDTVYASATFYLSDNVENLTLLNGGDSAGKGNSLDNIIHGNDGANLLQGLGGADQIFGGLGADTLDGGSGADRLDGGAGADELTGGTGADIFIFRSGVFGDGAGHWDVITDFSHAAGDRIDLTAIDGDTAASGYQHLAYVGAAAFSNHAGELRATAISGGYDVAGDTDGDGAADFHLQVLTTGSLQAWDFLV